MPFTDAELDALSADYAEATRPIRASFVAAIHDEQQMRGPYRARVMNAAPRLIDEVRTLSAQCADLRAQLRAANDEVG
jgi:hypothetical protein